MKVSLSWLNTYVSVEMDVLSLAEALTMAGLEVEAVYDRYDRLSKVCVGRIVDIKPHPNADQLSCCRVALKDRIVPVVCGASNIKAGMQVPVALPGAVLSHDLAIEKSVIRGEISEGMLCSEFELGLGTDQSGIMVLDPSAAVGDSLVAALGLSDMVLDIDLTPNRPDCLSIIGIAREVAAIQKTKIKYPEFVLSEGHGTIFDLTSVDIQDPDLCPRYAARLIENIGVGPSPYWLQDRLLSIGLRPINNVVDITNFVMMELGQPLHAFDFDHLAENRIVVRRADDGETFFTLDEKERRLNREILMICDGEKPVAIGGVMGGLNSEIEAATRNVLLESAYFNPVSIRKTSKALGLNTDASHRFERGVDPEGTLAAVNRAAQLIAEIGKGRLIGGIIDEHPGKTPPKKLTLSVSDTNRLLGTRFTADEIKQLLASIEIDVAEKNPEALDVTPPSFRVDIERPVDLMEEVARLSGYQNIPTTMPLLPTETREPELALGLRSRIKRIMVGFGFTETINYSFINDNSCDRLRLDPADPRRAMLGILNPLSEDQAVMRTSLLPGIFGTMHRNLARQNRDMKLFEAGKIFISHGRDELPEEFEMLAGLWTGSRQNPSWHSAEATCDFYDIKGVVEGLLNTLDISGITYASMPSAECFYIRPGYSARIYAGSHPLGLVGEVNPTVLDRFDLKQRAFIFELNLSDLSARLPDTKQFKPIPRFPAISRDLTMIIDKKIEAGSVIASISDLNEDLVENVHLFAVYEKEPIPPGKRSISIRITYRSPDETLEDDVINDIHKKISERILKQFDASLPA